MLINSLSGLLFLFIISFANAQIEKEKFRIIPADFDKLFRKGIRRVFGAEGKTGKINNVSTIHYSFLENQ